MPPATIIDRQLESGEPSTLRERHEVIDGRIVELPQMGSYHQIIVSGLSFALAMTVQSQRLGRVVVEMLFDFSTATGRKMRPDVAFVSEQRWPR